MTRLLLPFSRVLVPTDLSPGAEAAVDAAVRVADGADVVLLHVFSFPYDWYHWPSAALVGLRKHVEHEAGARLATLARRKTTPRVRVRPRLVVHADVASSIVEAAEAEGADLVVMGTRGWGRERPALGSVTEQVVRRGGRPVLVVPRSAPAVPLGRVVVPVDLSDAAAEALRFGHALAARWSAPLLVVHAVGPDVAAAEAWGGEAVEASDAPLAAQYERALRRFVAGTLGGEAEVRLALASGTADGLLGAAEPTDLLVLTPRQGGGLTEAVLAHAPCPALVLPSPTRPTAPTPSRPAPARRAERPALPPFV